MQPPSTRKDSSRSALDFVHDQFLAGGDSARGLDVLLGGLAVAFQAAGAGLATFAAGGLEVQARAPGNRIGSEALLPWQRDSTCLEQIGPSAGAVALSSEQVTFL